MKNNHTAISFVCIGSPLVDVITSASTTFLKTYGLETNSATVMTNKQLFQDILTKDCKTVIGGSITNTVRVLQTILRGKHAVTYLGSIGKDENGRLIEENLKKEGVQCIFKVSENIPTGMCAVLINGENRSLCTYLGASKLYSIEDLRDSRVEHSLTKATCIYFSGFFLGVSYECVENISKRKNKIIAFNIGATFLCKKYPQEILEILKYVDIIIGNEQEARALADIMDVHSEDIKTICNRIKMFKKYKNQDRVVVITRGADSIVVASKNDVKEYNIPKIKSKEIVDTNGAGDAFAGGFLAKFIEGFLIEEAVRCGIRAAQEIIKNVGCCFDKDALYTINHDASSVPTIL